MKRYVLLVATLTASLLFTFGQQKELAERLRTHIDHLTSEELAGRKAGSPEGYLAGDYIRGQFDSFGLLTFERADYYHPFATSWEKGTFRNVVGRISGVQKDSYIVIGAHYDHLGRTGNQIYHGADDNASGTAALIEVARIFSEMNYRPQHTLIFAAFDAEEIGLYGSADLAARFPQGSVKAMINMDMVGWLKDGELNVEGVGTLLGAEEMVYEVADNNQIEVSTKRFERGFLTTTDSESFASRGFPTLSCHTGFDSPYHKPEDTAEKIDYEGLALITQTVVEMTKEIDSSEDIAPSGKIARKHRNYNKGLELGLHASYGNNHFRYPNTAFVGQGAGAWSAGLSLMYSHNHFGLRVGATYNTRKALVPSDSSNPYSTAEKLSMSSLTVPLELMVRTTGMFSFYATAGAYYSLNLSAERNDVEYLPAELTLTQDEWGWQWGLGVRIDCLFLETTRRYGITPLFEEGPTIQNRSRYVTLGLFF